MTTETEGRVVRISQKTRNVMQSADKNAQGWVIQFDPQARWENNTMGWGSTADPLSNVDGWMNFKTKEAAIAFANRQGWEVNKKHQQIYRGGVYNNRKVVSYNIRKVVNYNTLDSAKNIAYNTLGWIFFRKIFDFFFSKFCNNLQKWLSITPKTPKFYDNNTLYSEKSGYNTLDLKSGKVL